MRLVLDTNTAISGLLWGGTPGTLIDAAASGRIELASTLALLAELQGVLSRTKFSSQLARRSLTLGDVFNGYATLVAIVSPATITPTVISAEQRAEWHHAAHDIGDEEQQSGNPLRLFPVVRHLALNLHFHPRVALQARDEGFQLPGDARTTVAALYTVRCATDIRTAASVSMPVEN